MKTKKFIDKVIELYGNFYDFALTEYVSSRKIIKIVCNKHGLIETTPEKFLKNGCYQCKKEKEYLDKYTKVHNDKYDYSLFVYINNKTKSKIMCPIHGVFEQLPYTHSVGKGCPDCSNNKKKTISQFIQQARYVHGEKYNYSSSVYINDSTKIKIICKKHNMFLQTPNSHLSGSGCPYCKYESKKSNKLEFVKKSNMIHNFMYDYSNVEYIDNKTKVKIVCPKHGIFEQLPKNHLKGQGCTICKESKGENKIRLFLEENKINYVRQKKFSQCKNKRPLPFDFYLPQHKTCIEYDGIQHFKPIEYFGGENMYNYIKHNDNIKENYCKNNDIKLIRISYDENIYRKLIRFYKIKLV